MRTRHTLLSLALGFVLLAPAWLDPAPSKAPAPSRFPIEEEPALEQRPEASTVRVIERDGGFDYVVNNEPQLFIGMGYNPIYRHLSDGERAARYVRDFQALCQLGVNHIIGWDADKGYEQDKFDEVTLDVAHAFGIGVVMPFYLPATGDYTDEAFLAGLEAQAATKVQRFKDHPALRMWAAGNEVLADQLAASLPEGMDRAFLEFYVRLAELFNRLDLAHPVLYREAEALLPKAVAAMEDPETGPLPWLLFGMNSYSSELDSVLARWPWEAGNRPVFITEFGAHPEWAPDRAEGYSEMWRTLRKYPDYVLGGAPYAWTTAGPEPTDSIWGLTDETGVPIDGTLATLARQWRGEPSAAGRACGSHSYMPLAFRWASWRGSEDLAGRTP